MQLSKQKVWRSVESWSIENNTYIQIDVNSSRMGIYKKMIQLDRRRQLAGIRTHIQCLRT